MARVKVKSLIETGVQPLKMAIVQPLIKTKTQVSLLYVGSLEYTSEQP